MRACKIAHGRQFGPSSVRTWTCRRSEHLRDLLLFAVDEKHIFQNDGPAFVAGVQDQPPGPSRRYSNRSLISLSIRRFGAEKRSRSLNTPWWCKQLVGADFPIIELHADRHRNVNHDERRWQICRKTSRWRTASNSSRSRPTTAASRDSARQQPQPHKRRDPDEEERQRSRPRKIKRQHDQVGTEQAQKSEAYELIHRVSGSFPRAQTMIAETIAAISEGYRNTIFG